MKKTLTLSLIIPVYNEESHLRACLSSIAGQSVMPDEVIVVDNNSTDDSVKIAQSFPFVRIVHERTQGLIAARNKGMDKSIGDILGRLDADTVLSPDWVKNVKELFSDHTEVDAVTGPAKTFVDSHFPHLLSTFWSRIYFCHSLSVFRFQILWGPNMAVRRTTWLAVKDMLSVDDKAVHEDQDLSIVLQAHGFTIRYDPHVLIATDGRRLAYLPKALEYQKRKKMTLAHHKNNGNLAQARVGGLNVLSAWTLSVLVLPFGLVFGLLSGLYSAERLLKLRK